MNKEMCDEILEEFDYFVRKTNDYGRGCRLTTALQIRKLSSSKKR